VFQKVVELRFHLLGCLTSFEISGTLK